MTADEIRKELENADTETYCFIKRWRKQSEFADYQLVEDFLEHLESGHEFEGYELLSREAMWNELKRRAGDRVELETRHGDQLIRWHHKRKDGTEKEEVCPFTDKSIMTIFDVETHGDTHI